jgi:polysaccharide export outer membrane protein
MTSCIRTLLIQGAIGFLMMIMAPAAVWAQPAAPAPIGPAPIGQAPIAQGPVAAPVAAPPVADENYIIGPGDVVDVTLLERTDFNTRAKVGTDGMIQLPYIGAIAAADRTAQTLRDQIKATLIKGGYFSNPNLSVQVASFASRYVTVLGAVGAPGLVPIDRAYRLSEVLARVGGVHENAADYVIVRPAKGETRKLSVKALAIGDLTQDPYVSPGDTIFSPIAELFYISGQIKSPGSYPMLSDMSVRMAIARAGGLTDMGSDKGVKITRDGKKLNKVDQDTKVAPGDIIVIGERLF